MVLSSQKLSYWNPWPSKHILWYKNPENWTCSFQNKQHCYITWRPFWKMAATAAKGRIRVASISEMTCIYTRYMCTKYGSFTIMCMIFSISARLILWYVKKNTLAKTSLSHWHPPVSILRLFNYSLKFSTLRLYVNFSSLSPKVTVYISSLSLFFHCRIQTCILTHVGVADF